MGLFGTILEKLGLGKSTAQAAPPTPAPAPIASAGSPCASQGDGCGGCRGKA